MSAPPSASGGPTPARSAWLPPPTLPLLYFGGAHLAFGIACAVLVANPGLTGAFHYHPRAIALVHLVTLGWISGSILGALYIVGPLALGVRMNAGPADAAACGGFWTGAAVVAGAFWRGRYELVSLASILVLIAMLFVGVRVIGGLRSARLPRGVSVHLVLAFVNVLGAGILGVITAAWRSSGSLPASPLALALAHAHLAVLGWAVMMIFGVAYRLIPMFVPAAMPAGRPLVWSAVLLEAGAVGVAGSLLAGTAVWPWAIVTLAAFAAFFQRIRGIVRNRRPRPAELPARDWSTWQAHVSLLYLLVAALVGLYVAAAGASPPLAWIYGVAGLVGFISQMVVGIQGRLLPMHAWYGAMRAREGLPPAVSVHRLVEPRFALGIFGLWLAGVPLLAAGLALGRDAAVAAGGATLLAATMTSALYAARMVQRCR